MYNNYTYKIGFYDLNKDFIVNAAKVRRQREL